MLRLLQVFTLLFSLRAYGFVSPYESEKLIASPAPQNIGNVYSETPSEMADPDEESSDENTEQSGMTSSPSQYVMPIPVRRTTIIQLKPLSTLLTAKLPNENLEEEQKMPYEDFNQILNDNHGFLESISMINNDKQAASLNLQAKTLSKEKTPSRSQMNALEDEFIAKNARKNNKNLKSASEAVDNLQSKLESFEDTLKSILTPQNMEQLQSSENELDLHSINVVHNNFSRSKMYDLVKNVNSYTDFNLLMAAQLILPKADSKDFVDRPTKRPISEIRRDFNRLRKRLGIQNFSKALKNNKAQNNDIGFQTSFTVKANPLGSLITSAAAEIASVASKTKIEMLKRFIDDNFDMPGTDLVPHDPEDWRPHPAILEETDSYGNEITNQNVKDVAIGLNDVWKELSRVKVEKKGRDSTLLSLPYPFMVPGGRFREFYYWDTYFILEGLIRSKMYESAFNIVRNFAHIIDKLGYIPNGTREYYKFRSQPPFFPLMLVKIMGINEEMDQFVLTEGLKMALNEYEWFRRYRSVHVKKGNKLYLLNFFHVKTDFPRPESLSEDIKTFLSQNVQSEGEIFSNLKSGAESGWDFSSRWFKGEGIETISAYNQIPVDLNAILFKNEQIISKLLEKVGDLEKAREFGDLSIRRHEAINEVLWNDNIGTWNDVRLDDHTFVDQRFFFSNVFPLIFDITPPSKTQESRKKLKKNDLLSDSPEDAQNIGRATENTIYTVLNAHKKELFSYKGGVPTSGEGPSEQQWDFPNVWAPHQYLIVEKLNSIGEKDMALQIARAFYNSVKAGFLQSKVFYEKYNCLKLGLTGKGGEYEAQTGFGWTNGTALSFIHMFGDLLDDDYDVQNEYEKISELLAAKVSGNEN